MHNLLRQQLECHFPGGVPQSVSSLLQAINLSYEQADIDRTTLERSLEVIRTTFNASYEGIMVTDHQGNRILSNQRYLQLHDLTEQQLEHMDRQQLLKHSMSKVTEPERLAEQMNTLVGHPGNENHAIYHSHDGRWLKVYACNNPVIGYIWMISDITEIRQKEATIQHQAHHDALTKLPNKLSLINNLEVAIERAKHENNYLALCYLDLDAFKTINDSLGHEAGDQLLVLVSQRLKTRIRSSDTLARIGGDEFAIVLGNIQDQQEVLFMAERLLMALNEPILLQERKFFMGASMGISVFPKDGETPSTLLKNADIAMYQAKENGKKRFHFFTPSLERIAQQRLAMEINLRKALDNNELELYYQPKVLLQSGNNEQHSLHSFEALLRWPQADGSFIPPDQFIPIAEDTGMISRISQWVLEQAAQQAKEWQARGLTTNISINISPKQFLIPDFEHEIFATLDQMNIPHHLISIEITETILMQNLDSARSVLEYFRDNGIFVYLDDFGTGFCSLNYLKNLPVDSIKIDRTFVKDISENKADQAIASSIITLGKNLGMLIVAEGIETQEQADILMAHGCDLAQGYFYGHPVNAKEAEQFFTLPNN